MTVTPGAISSTAKIETFENGLLDDLPRGRTQQARGSGVERGLFARWTTADEMTDAKWRYDANGGLLLGRRGGQVIGCKDDRHVMTIAGSRAGKGVSLIIPNLLKYEGSAVVIDPKGENAARTARHRRQRKEGGNGLGQKVYVLDPFGSSGITSASFNPLSALDVDSDDFIEDAALIADALIVHPERGERHWTESAQALLRALIVLVKIDIRFAECADLVTVRRLLMLTDPELMVERDTCLPTTIADRGLTKLSESNRLTAQGALLSLLIAQRDTRYGNICAGVAEQVQAMGETERGSVLSSARTQTQWLDSERMADVLKRSDFDLANIKRQKTTVYLCLPARRMTTHSRWLRLMVLLSINVMERVVVDEKIPPVLFVLDEFPVLGHMEVIEKAAGLMAGYGVKLWVIVQNIGQLKQHYEKSWETFVANSGVVTAFSISDSETLKMLSESLGRMGIVERVRSGASDSALKQGASPLQDDRREAPLLAEHELRLAFGRKKNRVLIFNVEDNPAVAERITYWDDDPMFAGLYDPDPKFAVAGAA